MSDKKKFFFFRWFTKEGWIGRLFNAENAKEINLQEISAKGVQVLDTVLLYEADARLISSAFSDNAEASTVEVIEVLKGLKERLTDIQTTVDVAENLEDYTFSNDALTDDFIKDELKLVSMAVQDGFISKLEALPIITRVIQFIKDRKNED